MANADGGAYRHVLRLFPIDLILNLTRFTAIHLLSSPQVESLSRLNMRSLQYLKEPPASESRVLV